jgi:hypothetical protein
VPFSRARHYDVSVEHVDGDAEVLSFAAELAIAPVVA